MKRYFLFFAVFSLFIGCSQDQEVPEVPPEEPEVPEEPELTGLDKCACCNGEPVEGYSWFREVVWSCETPMVQCLSNMKPMDFCQIPDDVLYSLTTEELLEICIQYPELYDWCVFLHQWDSVRDCICHLNEAISRFNGLSELFKREDCVYELLKRYDEMIDNIPKLSTCSRLQGESTQYSKVGKLFKDMEILISGYQTDSDAAVETYREILLHLVAGYDTMLMFPKIFTISQLNSNFIARMYTIDKIRPGALRSKIESAGWKNVEGIDPTAWYYDLIDLIPCYNRFYPDQNEGIFINELSYELIK